MDTVDVNEAKTHLNQLLERVADGEKITIMRHGIPVATLHPASAARRFTVTDTIDRLKQFRVGHRLDGPSVRGMIDEGRR